MTSVSRVSRHFRRLTRRPSAWGSVVIAGDAATLELAEFVRRFPNAFRSAPVVSLSRSAFETFCTFPRFVGFACSSVPPSPPPSSGGSAKETDVKVVGNGSSDDGGGGGDNGAKAFEIRAPGEDDAGREEVPSPVRRVLRRVPNTVLRDLRIEAELTDDDLALLMCAFPNLARLAFSAHTGPPSCGTLQAVFDRLASLTALDLCAAVGRDRDGVVLDEHEPLYDPEDSDDDSADEDFDYNGYADYDRNDAFHSGLASTGKAPWPPILRVPPALVSLALPHGPDESHLWKYARTQMRHSALRVRLPENGDDSRLVTLRIPDGRVARLLTRGARGGGGRRSGHAGGDRHGRLINGGQHGRPTGSGPSTSPCWPRSLKSLTLGRGVVRDGNSVDRLLSQTPALECLTFDHWRLSSPSHCFAQNPDDRSSVEAIAAGIAENGEDDDDGDGAPTVQARDETFSLSSLSAPSSSSSSPPPPEWTSLRRVDLHRCRLGNEPLVGILRRCPLLREFRVHGKVANPLDVDRLLGSVAESRAFLDGHLAYVQLPLPRKATQKSLGPPTPSSSSSASSSFSSSSPPSSPSSIAPPQCRVLAIQHAADQRRAPEFLADAVLIIGSNYGGGDGGDACVHAWVDEGPESTRHVAYARAATFEASVHSPGLAAVLGARCVFGFGAATSPLRPAPTVAATCRLPLSLCTAATAVPVPVPVPPTFDELACERDADAPGFCVCRVPRRRWMLPQTACVVERAGEMYAAASRKREAEKGITSSPLKTLDLVHRRVWWRAARAATERESETAAAATAVSRKSPSVPAPTPESEPRRAVRSNLVALDSDLCAATYYIDADLRRAEGRGARPV